MQVPTSQQGGDWATGYHPYKDDYFIFCGIGTPGRTGHDYGNRFDGDELVWYGKGGAKLSHPSIQRFFEPYVRAFVFYRFEQRAPFIYAGLGVPVKAYDCVPASIRWSFPSLTESHPERPPEEIVAADAFFEGAVKSVTVNRYERNPQARRACIAHYGARCAVCSLVFSDRYGELGDGFIHVHHVKPLGEVDAGYIVDPIADLIPVCANCHAMLHRQVPALTVEELREAYCAPLN